MTATPFKLSDTREEFEELVLDTVRKEFWTKESTPFMGRFTLFEQKVNQINENLKIYKEDFLKFLELNKAFRREMKEDFGKFRRELRGDNQVFRTEIREEMEKRFKEIDQRVQRIDERFFDIQKAITRIDDLLCRRYRDHSHSLQAF